MRRCQSRNINWSLEEIDSTLMDDFEDFKTSVEKVTAGVVEIVKLQLEVKVWKYDWCCLMKKIL